MSKSNRAKRKKQAASLATQKERIEIKDDIPDAFSNAIFQTTNSLVNLRGPEPKQVLASGQMLIKLDRFAIVPLDHYQEMLALIRRAQGLAKKVKQEDELAAAKRKIEQMHAAKPTSKQEEVKIATSKMADEIIKEDAIAMKQAETTATE